MTHKHRGAPPAIIAAAAVRRPRLVVALAVVVLALSALSLSRMRMEASLEAMLGAHSDSARAFQRVMRDFRAAESLLVLIEPAPAAAATPADAARLADLLVEALGADPRTRDSVAWAHCRRDGAYAAFVAQRIAPNAPYYLGPEATRELLDRLAPERLARQFARNEALIASPGPAGDALSRAVLRDPLRLFELAAGAGLVMPDADTAAPGEQAHEFSTDARAVLVRIASAASINDLEQARLLVRSVTDIAAELQESAGLPGLSVRLAGAYAIAAASAEAIRADAVRVTFLSVALIYLLFVVFSRRWLPPLLIAAAAGVGLAAGFAVHALAQPAVSPLATVVAALLAGLGVDYGVHFVSHFDALRAQGASAPDAAARTARAMAMPITANCFTSIFGFIALWPSQIQMLSDFARLGAAGLLGAWLSVFTLLPAMLVLTHRGSNAGAHTAPRFGALADAARRRPRLFASTALTLLALAVVALAAGTHAPRIESDLTVLHPQPNAALDATNETLSRFAGHGEIIPILVDAPSAELLLPAAIDAAHALMSDACRAAGVVEVYGVHRLLPDPRGADAVHEALAAADTNTLLRNFDSALESSPFEPAAYTAYRDLLEAMLTADTPPGVADVIAFPSIAQRLLPAGALAGDAPARQTVLVVRLAEPMRERKQRSDIIATLASALDATPGATIAALAAVSMELEGATSRDLPRSMAISFTLVLCWLMLMLRRPADVALALVPLAYAALCVIGLMTAFDVRFNPINIVAIPLLFGIAVDAGVFLVAGARRASNDGADRDKLTRRLRPTMHAVLLAAATTITGFLSLSATHTPAIRSLGVLAAIGIAASFCAAAGLLAPWLLHRAPRRRA